VSDELNYKIFARLHTQPETSQRALSKELGVSLGKVNYCLQALIEKGCIKANNFRNSDNKKAYAYFLTPKGVEEKAQVTLRFLEYKQNEYEALREEIDGILKAIDTKG